MRIRDLLGNQRGDVVTEFIIVAPLFFAIFFGGLAVFWSISWLQFVEAATQAGVRTAVVRSPMVALPESVNQPSATGFMGQTCTQPGGAAAACLPFSADPITCTGSACTQGPFIHMRNRMREVFPLIPDEAITVSYAYGGLGIAGGQVVPIVTVSVSPEAICTANPGELFCQTMTIIGGLMDLGQDLIGEPDPGNGILRDVSATMTAEDLNTAGSL
jgi:hypothetical protein